MTHCLLMHRCEYIWCAKHRCCLPVTRALSVGAALHIFNAPQWCMQALLVARLLVRNTVDSYLDWYIGKKLELLMNERQLERIIHLLHGTSVSCPLHCCHFPYTPFSEIRCGSGIS